MASEFKIKNALLIEGSTNSQPVVAIRDSSLEITSDASSLLVTAKAIHDYVSSVAGDSYWELDGSTLKPKDETVNVELSAIQIDTDAGEVSLVDMDVSSAGSGVAQSYSFNIDGEAVAKIYAEGDGAGGIREEKLVSIKPFVAESSVYFSGIAESTQTKILYYNPTSGLISYEDACTGGISSVAWGDITGSLKDQTDVSTAIDAKQDALTFGTLYQIPYSNGSSDFNYDSSLSRTIGSSNTTKIDGLTIEYSNTAGSINLKNDGSTFININKGLGGTIIKSLTDTSSIQIYPNNINYDASLHSFSQGSISPSYYFHVRDASIGTKLYSFVVSPPGTSSDRYLAVKPDGTVYCSSIGASTQTKALYYNTGTGEITYGDPCTGGGGGGGTGDVAWASGNVGSNNQLITANGDGSIVSESNLTFDGTTLTATGDIKSTNRIIAGGLADVHATALYQGKIDTTLSYQNYLLFKSEDSSISFTISNGNTSGLTNFFPIFSGKVQGGLPGLYFLGDSVTGPTSGNAIIGFDARRNNTTANASDIALGFYSGWGNSLAVIMGDGKVGIGTTTPASKLTVVGDASISGNILGSNLSWNTTTRILEIIPGNTAPTLGSARLGMANFAQGTSYEQDYLYSGHIVLGTNSALGSYAMGTASKSYRGTNATYTYAHMVLTDLGSLHTKYNANATDSTAASGGTWRLHPYITGNTNNRVLTATGAGDINGEANLTFDGTVLVVAGGARLQGDPSATSSGGLTLKLGKLVGSPSSATDAFVAINDTGGPGTLAGDLIIMPRSSIADTAIRMFSGSGTPTQTLTVRNGNVGIGVVSPGSKLAVQGDASISGNVTVASTSYHYMGAETTDGSWRWFINGSGDLEFQKRVSGTWTYKGKFS